MTAKGQTNWPPEKLEEWAKSALAYPELVEIARTATSNNEAKKRALKREDSESLAQACRWLRILRVNYSARFEKLISRDDQNYKQEKKEVEEKNKREISILVDGIERVSHGNGKQLKTVFEFKTPEAVISAAIGFLEQIERDEGLVQKMAECFDKTPLVYNDFRMKLIQVLEERFGLLIRICWNCAHYRGFGTRTFDRDWIDADNYAVFCRAPEHKDTDKWDLAKYIYTPCEFWVPRKDKIKSAEGFPGTRSTAIPLVK